jgi:hypothetical protein
MAQTSSLGVQAFDIRKQCLFSALPYGSSAACGYTIIKSKTAPQIISVSAAIILGSNCRMSKHNYNLIGDYRNPLSVLRGQCCKASVFDGCFCLIKSKH